MNVVGFAFGVSFLVLGIYMLSPVLDDDDKSETTEEGGLEVNTHVFKIRFRQDVYNMRMAHVFLLPSFFLFFSFRDDCSSRFFRVA